MKQLLQHLKDGHTEIAQIPRPEVGEGQVQIRSRRTLVSAGTERMLVEFSRGGLISKARQQPEKVRQVIDKVKTDGLATTYEAVKSKLDQPLALGYSNVGEITKVGSGVTGFAVGDRVVSNGPHAEYVVVSKNLCCKVPDAVSDDDAVYTVVASIGLQGVRLAEPSIGECFVVVGLGLIGLLTGQILRANGCRVLGIDLDELRLKQAQGYGLETANPARGDDVLSMAKKFSRGRGVDGVILTLASTSSQPVRQAAQMCRKRGRIILVGVTGLELDRSDFYEKEIAFQVSCSYGAGRYDHNYEVLGQDYPIGYVRWTECRNFEAVLDMFANDILDAASLTTHRFSIEKGKNAYDLLVGDSSALGIMLEYPQTEHALDSDTLVHLKTSPELTARERPRVSFIGAGNYAGRVLGGIFKRAGAALDTVVTLGGVSAVTAGKQFGFLTASTEPNDVFGSECDAVVIATRHDTHAEYVIRALQSGKHVFVEKPLALTVAELEKITATYNETSGLLLMVGFNRRFAPQVSKIRSLLDMVAAPKVLMMTVNAGEIPADHWTQNREIGGGRIVGEACHHIDLFRYLVDESISDWSVTSMAGIDGTQGGDDCAAITLNFEDGSFGVINYLANGHREVAKERLEIFCAGRVIQLDNFRKLNAYGWPGFKKWNLFKQDKGQEQCIGAFISAITTGSAAPVAVEELLEVSRASILIAEQARQARKITD